MRIGKIIASTTVLACASALDITGPLGMLDEDDESTIADTLERAAAASADDNLLSRAWFSTMRT